MKPFLAVIVAIESPFREGVQLEAIATFDVGGAGEIEGVSRLARSEFNAAFLVDRRLLDRFHLALQAGKLCCRRVISLDEEQGRPKENDADAGGDRIARRFRVLLACRLDRAR